MTDIILTVILAVIGSSGLWAFLQFLLTRKRMKKENLVARMEQHEKQLEMVTKMSLGALYDRAKFLGEQYIKRQTITTDEYEDYKKYIYEPYHAAGGDGTIDRIMKEIEQIPLSTEEGGKK